MATKTLYAIKDFRYGTRMMRAGDPVDMDASHQRLYSALGAVTAEKPKTQEDEKPLDKMTKAELVSLANVPEQDAKNYTKAQLIAKIRSK